MGNNLSHCCAKCFPRFESGSSEHDTTVTIEEASSLANSCDLAFPDECFAPELELETLVSGSDQMLMNQVNEAAEKFEQLLQQSFNDSDLELILDLKECKVYAKDTDKGFLMLSGWESPHPLDQVMKFIADAETRRKWDTSIATMECVKQLTPETGVYYQTYKKVFPLAQRDLLFINKFYRKGEALLDVSCSVELQDYPEQSGVVRAKVYLGGYHMEQLPQKSGTKISCISELNFGGTVPKMLVKKVSANAIPSFIKNINAAIRGGSPA